MVIDEALDRSILEAMQAKDEKRLVSHPEQLFNWGTGEIRNWTVVAGAMEETDKAMHLLAYEPCYRSPAGTGCACAFASWQ
jgi:OH-DDVA oxygenase